MKKLFYLFSVLRRHGFFGCIKKAFEMLKREGVDGIHQRMSQTKETGIQTRIDYAEWIRNYNQVYEENHENILSLIQDMPFSPLISVILPISDIESDWLAETIQSVRHQIYPHWELCITGDVSKDAAIKDLLETVQIDDARIRFVFSATHGHAFVALNKALKISNGEWIALLYQGDLLAEHALFHVASTINCNPQARLIYSDEDRLDLFGTRYAPYFKCDWNPDLFYSHNMFSHLGVYYKSLVDSVGGFRGDMDDVEEYDLILRCIERIEIDKILHIPHVLYHRRTYETTEVGKNDEREGLSPALPPGLRALNEHFQRKDIKSCAEITPFGYRVRYTLPDTLPLVSLIIPTRNSLKLLRTCIESILEKTSYSAYEIIVVDNGSDEPETLSWLNTIKRHSNIKVLRDDRPFNYSALNNLAVTHAQGEIIGLINNDIEVISVDWLSEMVSHVLRPEIGAVGGQVVLPGSYNTACWRYIGYWWCC